MASHWPPMPSGFPVIVFIVFMQVEIEGIICGSFPKKGDPSIDPQNTRILMVGSPKRGTNNLGESPYASDMHVTSRCLDL